jgi:LuxR family maltose regulon positive regulatory protein
MWDLVRQQRRPAQEVEDFFVATLRVQLHFGETKPVLAEAERELARAVREARHYRAMKLRVLLALGLHKAGDPSRAGREMGLVLRQASREGFVRLLFVSDSTVRTHLRNINLKLKTNSRTQAVAAARKLRVIR